MVSYLPERTSLPLWMTVKQLQDFYEDFYADFQRERSEEMLDRLEISAKQRMKHMAKGTREKVQLILAMSRQAKLYLLDEPIGGVDPAARDYILDTIIRNYNPEASVIISTHLIAEVADLIEHTVIIRQGRILQDAPTEELTAACWAVSGPAGVVDSWAAGRDVFTSSVLGGLKTVCIRGGGTEDLPAGLERRRVGLQEYFISVMEEEDQR